MEKLPPLYKAVVEGDVDRVKELLKKKWYRKAADVNGYDTKCGFTPLHRAIECRNGKMVRLLLSQKPAPDVNVCFAGVTPLDVAIILRFREGMQRLKEAGAKTARDLREEKAQAELAQPTQEVPDGSGLQPQPSWA